MDRRKKGTFLPGTHVSNVRAPVHLFWVGICYGWLANTISDSCQVDGLSVGHGIHVPLLFRVNSGGMMLTPLVSSGQMVCGPRLWSRFFCMPPTFSDFLGMSVIPVSIFGADDRVTFRCL